MALHFDAHKLAGVVAPNNNPWANEKLDKPEKIVLKSEEQTVRSKKEKVEQLEKEVDRQAVQWRRGSGE
jgi:hypothetical protein